MRRVLLTTLILALVMATGCASVPSHQELELGQDAFVTLGTDKPVKKKKGEVVEVGDVAALVEAPGYVSVLILPGQAGSARLKITLKALDNWLGEWSEERDNKLFDELMSNTLAVQRLATSHKFDEAKGMLDGLIQKYPKIAALKFMKVSLLIYSGHSGEARAVLTLALQQYPNSRGGRELERLLNGTERAPASGKAKVEAQ